MHHPEQFRMMAKTIEKDRRQQAAAHRAAKKRFMKATVWSRWAAEMQGTARQTLERLIKWISRQPLPGTTQLNEKRKQVFRYWIG
jgi:hypothetical protein